MYTSIMRCHTATRRGLSSGESTPKCYTHAKLSGMGQLLLDREARTGKRLCVMVFELTTMCFTPAFLLASTNSLE